MSNIQNSIEKEELWNALVDTAHALIMYKGHKRYVQEVMLKDRPDISPKELAIRLSIPLGESLVLLAETRDRESEGGKAKAPAEGGGKRDDRSLLDFTK
ncbi:MAG: hypothetical protein ABSF63_07270 [Candidatus Bathyarchaeia archaeon]|jgi:hypothetical protein